LAASRDMSALFDARRFARHLEKAFETMWATHLAGEAPRAFAVEPV
jgi:protein O-GlcNAc transferase